MGLKNIRITLLPIASPNIEEEVMNHMKPIDQESTVFLDEPGFSSASQLMTCYIMLNVDSLQLCHTEKRYILLFPLNQHVS